jgi:putative membrane protein
MLKYSYLITSLAFSLVLAAGAGCDDNNDNNSRVDGSAGTGGSGGTFGDGGGGLGGGGSGGAGQDGGFTVDAAGDASGDASTTPLADPAAAGVMLEANNGEIAAGQQATARATSAAVKSFGQQMVTDHTAANQRLLALLQRVGISPTDSPQRQMLAMQAQSTLDLLWTRTGAAFDTAYIQSQVLMHQQVLNLLDTVLIPGAQNAELKAELTTTRATVAAHLAAAQALQGADGGAGDAGSDAAVDGGTADSGGDAGAGDAAVDAGTGG